MITRRILSIITLAALLLSAPSQLTNLLSVTEATAPVTDGTTASLPDETSTSLPDEALDSLPESKTTAYPSMIADWYKPPGAKRSWTESIIITKTAPASYEETWKTGDSVQCYFDYDTTYICTGGADKISVPEDAAEIFRKFVNLRSISGLDLLDFSGCSCLDSMFIDCSLLESVDLSSCDLSCVESMDHAFSGCTSLKSIKLADDMPAVKDIDYLCYNNSAIESIDLSMMTAGDISLEASFNACENLKKINFGSFDADDDCNVQYTFAQNYLLEEFTVGDMFTDFNIIPSPGENVDGADGNWYSKTTGASYAPGDEFPQKADTYSAHPLAAKTLIEGTNFIISSVDRSSIKHIIFDSSYAPDGSEILSWDVSEYSDGSLMAYELSDSETIVVTFADPTEDGTFIFNPQSSGMFETLTSLTDIQGLDHCSGLNITDASYMFHACSHLTEIDVNNLISSNCTDISNMFYGCSSLTGLELTGWDTSSVWSMASAFRYCSSLSSLDLSGLNLSAVEDMGFMCADDGKLNEIIFPERDMDMLYCMPYIFRNCVQLTCADMSFFTCPDFGDNPVSLYEDVSEYDKTFFGAYEGMFYGCEKLMEINIASLCTDAADESTTDMFYNCRMLSKITLPSAFAYKTQLPDPDGKYIDGANGRWYGSDGTAYTKDNLPDTGGTYTAVYGDAAAVTVRIKASETADNLYLPFGYEYRRYIIYPKSDPDSYVSAVICFTEAGNIETEVEVTSYGETEYCLELLGSAQRDGDVIGFTLDTGADITEVYDGPRPLTRWKKAQACACAVIKR